MFATSIAPVEELNCEQSKQTQPWVRRVASGLRMRDAQKPVVASLRQRSTRNSGNMCMLKRPECTSLISSCAHYPYFLDDFCSAFRIFPILGRFLKHVSTPRFSHGFKNFLDMANSSDMFNKTVLGKKKERERQGEVSKELRVSRF